MPWSAVGSIRFVRLLCSPHSASVGLGWDLCQRSYTSAKKGLLEEGEGVGGGVGHRGVLRPREQQSCGRGAEGEGEGDEVVDVAAAAGAFGTAEGGVGHRAAQCGAAGGELVLGQA